ncbi:MAG: hypothetical protein SNJ72_07215 [Fimbriimonadales bacterium]
MKGTSEQIQPSPKRRVEPLIVGVLRVDTTPRDLLGTIGVDTSPSLTHCEGFRSFVWTGWKSGSADLVLFTLCGNGENWLQAFSTVVSGGAGSWFRAEIKPPKLYSAYRFVVVSSSVQEVRSKLIGYQQEVF